ncbi:unnamed protein product [Cyclocybe aegerita]|uniref:Uncharacterized protein n=1 Tax=Cyclocybe aegerita TaxID=1973307 RepID=A0A8S0Y0Q7_CYCAE|nr:unnamed protein product [Cyclocybe aegerita]
MHLYYPSKQAKQAGLLHRTSHSPCTKHFRFVSVIHFPLRSRSVVSICFSCSIFPSLFLFPSHLFAPLPLSTSVPSSTASDTRTRLSIAHSHSTFATHAYTVTRLQHSHSHSSHPHPPTRPTSYIIASDTCLFGSHAMLPEFLFAHCPGFPLLCDSAHALIRFRSHFSLCCITTSSPPFLSSSRRGGLTSPAFPPHLPLSLPFLFPCHAPHAPPTPTRRQKDTHAHALLNAHGTVPPSTFSFRSIIPIYPLRPRYDQPHRTLILIYSSKYKIFLLFSRLFLFPRFFSLLLRFVALLYSDRLEGSFPIPHSPARTEPHRTYFLL